MLLCSGCTALSLSHCLQTPIGCLMAQLLTTCQSFTLAQIQSICRQPTERFPKQAPVFTCLQSFELGYNYLIE